MKNKLFKTFQTPQKNAVIILVSGGLDSAILLAEEASKNKKVYPVFIKTGLRYEKAQFLALQKFIRALRNENIQKPVSLHLSVSEIFPKDHWALNGKKIPPLLSPDGSCYLPGWNLLILAPALTFAAQHGISSLKLAHVAHNPYPDGQAGFFAAFEKTAEKAFETKIKIERPYEKLEKSQVLKRGKNFPLQYTLTCINPIRNQHCGKCHKCAERHRGFLQARIIDTTFYVNSFQL